MPGVDAQGAVAVQGLCPPAMIFNAGRNLTAPDFNTRPAAAGQPGLILRICIYGHLIT